MLLYKYLSSDALNLFEDSKFKLSDVSLLNDPFEFQPKLKPLTEYRLNEILSNELFKKNLINFFSKYGNRETIVENLRRNKKEFIIKFNNNLYDVFKSATAQHAFLSCFTDVNTTSNNEILLWSHYAEKSKGLRIKIDSEIFFNTKLKHYKVKYSKDRFEIDFTLLFTNKDRFSTELHKAAITKSKVWKYENEYRILIKKPECEKIDINLNGIISVDFGINNNQQYKVIQIFKSKNFSNIKFRQAKLDKKKYMIFYEALI